MRFGIALLAGVNAALLLSTAAFAADPIEPIVEVAAAPAPAFALTIGAGVVGYHLPDSAGLDDVFYGGIVGVSLSAPLDPIGDLGVSINGSGFISLATRSGEATTETLTDDSTLVVFGPTLPAGVITLTTDPAAGTGSSDITGTGPTDQSAVITSNVGGVVQGFGVDPSGPGDEFTYVGTSGDSVADRAFSFGAIASEDGGIFVAVGDLEGWEVTTETSQNLLYAGGDLTFALSSNPASGDVGVTGYAGPSYRFMRLNTVTDITVDPAEMTPAVADFEYPNYTQSVDENVDTHYLGGVLGGNVMIPVSTTSSLTLGAEAGVYHATTSYDGSATYSVTGGGPTAVDESVTSAFDLGDTDDGFAYALRGQGTFTTAVSNQMQLSLGLGAEYLSRVASATTTLDGGSVTSDDEDATYDSAGAGTTTLFSYDDAWSWTATVSLTGQF